MLLGNKPNPGRQVASGRECFPITHLGNQGGGDDRTDARDLLEPPAFFTRSVPGMDMLLEGADFCRDVCVLVSKNVEANRAVAGIRSSSAFAMISNSSAVPLRPLAEIRPSSAMCPRIAFDSIVR